MTSSYKIMKTKALRIKFKDTQLYPEYTIDNSSHPGLSFEETRHFLKISWGKNGQCEVAYPPSAIIYIAIKE